MIRSFSMRNTVVALLIAFASCAGCTAAAKQPIPPPTSDAALPDARKADRRLCRWVLLGNAIGV